MRHHLAHREICESRLFPARRTWLTFSTTLFARTRLVSERHSRHKRPGKKKRHWPNSLSLNPLFLSHLECSWPWESTFLRRDTLGFVRALYDNLWTLSTASSTQWSISILLCMFLELYFPVYKKAIHIFINTVRSKSNQKRTLHILWDGITLKANNASQCGIAFDVKWNRLA